MKKFKFNIDVIVKEIIFYLLRLFIGLILSPLNALIMFFVYLILFPISFAKYNNIKRTVKRLNLEIENENNQDISSMFRHFNLVENHSLKELRTAYYEKKKKK